MLLFPILFAVGLVRKKYRNGLSQRLGFDLSVIPPKGRKRRVWMHASSVGEVQAARALINELKSRGYNLDIVVSTMTPHGKNVAQEQLPADVHCIISPLDVPFITARVITWLEPDVYVCLETELWPSILKGLNKRGVPILLLNGRMSVRSVVTYGHFGSFFKQVIDNFNLMAFITTADMDRYISLGADRDKCVVGGNVKYDLPLPDQSETVAEKYRKQLGIDSSATVFVSGSTHTGEEEQLLALYNTFSSTGDFVWITAPRHLERIGTIEKNFVEQEVGFELFTELRNGKSRSQNLIIVDVMGELSQLYSIADYVFCGGSLVEKGGHNIMEAAIWDKGVFYGPSMYDYKDAVSLLEFAEAGFKVNSSDELAGKINYFQDHLDEYESICHRAGTIAHAQQGAAGRQADFILEQLHVS